MVLTAHPRLRQRSHPTNLLTDPKKCLSNKASPSSSSGYQTNQFLELQHPAPSKLKRHGDTKNLKLSSHLILVFPEEGSKSLNRHCRRGDFTGSKAKYSTKGSGHRERSSRTVRRLTRPRPRHFIDQIGDYSRHFQKEQFPPLLSSRAFFGAKGQESCASLNAAFSPARNRRRERYSVENTIGTRMREASFKEYITVSA